MAAASLISSAGYVVLRTRGEQSAENFHSDLWADVKHMYRKESSYEAVCLVKASRSLWASALSVNGFCSSTMSGPRMP
jgi:hypothetical protein